MKTSELVTYLNEYLHIAEAEDRSNNGLQVEGAAEVTRVAFAVDACLSAFQAARKIDAQMLIVHHGLFWSEVKLVTGPHLARLKTLIEGGVNLYAAHLPLDQHAEVGNNVELCRLLGLIDVQPWGQYKGRPAGYGGSLPQPLLLHELVAQIADCRSGGDLFRRRVVFDSAGPCGRLRHLLQWGNIAHTLPRCQRLWPECHLFRALRHRDGGTQSVGSAAGTTV